MNFPLINYVLLFGVTMIAYGITANAMNQKLTDIKNFKTDCYY